MVNVNISSEYILSRLDKIEHRQKVMSKYVANLKYQLNMLQSEFQTTEQLQEWESLKEQVLDLQQRFNGLLTFNCSPSLPISSETPVESDEVRIQFFLEEVDQEFIEELLEQQEQAETGENGQHIQPAIASSEQPSVFTDLEFKMERAMMLVNRFYRTE
ncbi:MAG: hypothetical protein ACOC0N_11090 [Chroococcales cyanobacterium]